MRGLHLLLVAAFMAGPAPAWADDSGAPLEQAPRREGSVRIRAAVTPPGLVLGKHPEASITLTVTDAGGEPVLDADLELSATAGGFTGLHALGDGRYVAGYLPPSTRFPQAALVAVIDRAHPGSGLLFPIPLIGTTRFPVQARAGMTLEFEVAGQRFGPFPTDDAGVAQVQLEVPPGVTRARVIGRHEGVDEKGTREQWLELPAPSFPRIKMLPPPPHAADGQTPLMLTLLAVDPSGQPMAGAPLEVSAALGVVSPPVEAGGGIYRARYVPPRSSEGREETLIVRLRGGDPGQEDRVLLKLMPGPPPPAPAVDPLAGSGEPALPARERPLTPLETPPAVVLPPEAKALLEGSRSTSSAFDPEKPGPGPEQPASTPEQPASKPGQPASTPAKPAPEQPAPAPAPSAPPAPAGRPGMASWIPGQSRGAIPLAFGPPPPRPRIGLYAGGRIYPLLGGGVYRFVQQAALEDGTLPPGEQRILRPTIAAGLGADYWFTPRLGSTFRYETAWYTFTDDSLEVSAGDVKQLVSLEARYRHPLRLAGMSAGGGARLGLSVQDHPAFERAPGGVAFVADNALLLALVGLEGHLFPKDRLELRAGYDLGIDLLRGGLVSHHLELDLVYNLRSGLSVGGAIEGWHRGLTARRASDGVVMGTLADLWVQAWGFVAIHF